MQRPSCVDQTGNGLLRLRPGEPYAAAGDAFHPQSPPPPLQEIPGCPPDMMLEALLLKGSGGLVTWARYPIERGRSPTALRNRLSGSLAEAFTCVEFVAVVFAERLRAQLTAVEPVRKLRRHSRPEL